MKTYQLTITPWDAPDCRRTVELADVHTLTEMHHVLQEAFELGDDHLWAFYLSGEFFDSETEFGPGRGAASPDVKLSDLSLEPGMRLAYLFDFGSELRHDLVVDAVEPRPSGTPPPPRVTARVGGPPRQDVAPEGEAQDAPPRPASPAPAPAGAPPAPPPQELVEEFSRLEEWLTSRAEGPLPRSRRAPLLSFLSRVLEVCLDRLSVALLDPEGDVEPALVLEELFDLLRDDEDDEELRALERRFAALPASDGHGHGFRPALVSELRWTLLRYDALGAALQERTRALTPAQLERAGEAALEACPDASRFAELTCELDAGRSLEQLLLDWLARSAPLLEEAPLRARLERMESLVAGRMQPLVSAIQGLVGAEQTPRARALLESIQDAPEALPPRAALRLAMACELVGDPSRAVKLYRQVLGRRWLSGELREFAVFALAATLRAQGLADEARALERTEEARRRTRAAERAGTVVNTSPKVGRNEPCPCGSGKKSKKCCAA